MNADKLLSLRECDARTGHKIVTWRAWVLGGKISYFKIGGSIRISEADLEEFIRAGHVGVRAPKAEAAAVARLATNSI